MSEKFYNNLRDINWNREEFGIKATTIDEMIAALQQLKKDNGGKNLTIGLQQTSQSPNDYDHYVDVALVVVKEDEKGEKTSEVIKVNGEDFEKCATVFTEYEADEEGGDDDDDEDDDDEDDFDDDDDDEDDED